MPIVSTKERASKRRRQDTISDSDSDSSEDSDNESSQDESEDSERSDEEDDGNSDDSDESAVNDLSEYEKLRLRNIERNNKVIEFYCQIVRLFTRNDAFLPFC